MIDKEKVRELKGFLAHKRKEPDTFDVVELFMLLDEWFEQNPVVPVFVGLSDEQVNDLAVCMQWESGCSAGKTLLSWLKAQTFEQYRAFDESELSEKYIELYDDYQSLLVDLSLQKKHFEPDWDNAPEWANWVAQDFNGSWGWFENKPEIESGISTKFRTIGRSIACFDNSNWQQTLQERPKPTPRVV